MNIMMSPSSKWFPNSALESGRDKCVEVCSRLTQDNFEDNIRCTNPDDPAFYEIQKSLTTMLQERIYEVKETLERSKQELNCAEKDKQEVATELYERQHEISQLLALMKATDKDIQTKEREIQITEETVLEFEKYYNQSLEACQLAIEAAIPAQWYEEEQFLQDLKEKKAELSRQERISALEIDKRTQILAVMIKEHSEMAERKGHILHELESIELLSAEYETLANYQARYEKTFEHDIEHAYAENTCLNTDIKQACKLQELTLNSYLEKVKRKHLHQDYIRSLENEISLKTFEYLALCRSKAEQVAEINSLTADISATNQELDMLAEQIDRESARKFETEQNTLQAKQKLEGLLNSQTEAEKVHKQALIAYNDAKMALEKHDQQTKMTREILRKTMDDVRFNKQSLQKLNKSLKKLEEQSEAKRLHEYACAEIQKIQIELIKLEGDMRALNKQKEKWNCMCEQKENNVARLNKALADTKKEHFELSKQLNLIMEQMSHESLTEQKVNVQNLKAKLDDATSDLAKSDYALRQAELKLLSLDSQHIQTKENLTYFREKQTDLKEQLRNLSRYHTQLMEMSDQETSKIKDINRAIENHHRILQRLHGIRLRVDNEQLNIRRRIEDHEDRQYIIAQQHLQFIFDAREEQCRLQKELEQKKNDINQVRNELTVWKEKDVYLIEVKKSLDLSTNKEIRSLENMERLVERKLSSMESIKLEVKRQIEVCVQKRLDRIAQRELYSSTSQWQKYMLDLDVSRVERNYRRLFNHKLKMTRALKEAKLHIVNVGHRRVDNDERNVALEHQLHALTDKRTSTTRDEIKTIKQQLNILQRKELALENLERDCDPVKLRHQTNVSLLLYKRCKKWLVIIMKCLAHMKTESRTLPFDELAMFKAIEDHFANDEIKQAFFAAVSAASSEPNELQAYFLEPSPVGEEFRTDTQYAPILKKEFSKLK